MFLWCACTNSLPVRTNLVQRGCSEDPICTLCGEEAETTGHMLLYCREVQPVWYASGLHIDLQQRQFATFQDFLRTTIEKHPMRNIALLAYIAWEIWKRRNTSIFDGKKTQFLEVIKRATHRWLEDEQSRERETSKEKKPQLQHKWSRLERGLYELNTDIAVGLDGAVGLGFVLQDCNGSVVLAGKLTCRATGSNTILEGMEIRYALQMVEQYKLQASHIECDNQGIVQLIIALKPMDLYAR